MRCPYIYPTSCPPGCRPPPGGRAIDNEHSNQDERLASRVNARTHARRRRRSRIFNVGENEHSNRYQSTTYLHGECSYRRAEEEEEEADEEEDIQCRSSARSQEPPCLAHLSHERPNLGNLRQLRRVVRPSGGVDIQTVDPVFAERGFGVRILGASFAFALLGVAAQV